MTSVTLFLSIVKRLTSLLFLIHDPDHLLKNKHLTMNSKKATFLAVGSCDPSELPQIENGRADPYKTRKFRGSVYKYSCDRDYNR